MKAHSVIISVILMSSLFVFANCTTCKPLSAFKIDCNVCTCSSSGHEYSCTEKRCPVGLWNNWVEEVNEDGYVLLKPKPTSAKDDYILTRRIKQIAFGNDDLYLSREDNKVNEDIDISN